MKKITSTLLTMLFVLSQFTSVNAQTQRYSDYAVKPIFPSSQIGDNSDSRGYFDLLLKPEQSDTLKLEVTNTGTEEMVVHLDLTNGVTRDNGESDYTSNEKPSEMIPYTMDSILSVKKNDVKVLPNESVIIDVDISMPKEEIDGVILGGIAVTASYESDSKTEENSIGVTSSIKYLIAVQVRNNENVIKPLITSGDAGVKEYMLKPAFYLTLKNNFGLNMSNVNFNGTIKRSKNGEVVAEVSKENKSVLPYSEFDVIFEMVQENSKIDYELYDYELEVNYEDETWHFSDSINLVKDDLKDVNESVKTDNSKWYIGGIVLLLLNGCFIYIIYRKKNK